MRWFSAVLLILYLSLLASPQVADTHAPHLTPLADSQLQAVNPLTGQNSLFTEQDNSDDNDNSLLLASDNPPFLLSLTISSLPDSVSLIQDRAAHPVRAPPLYSPA